MAKRKYRRKKYKRYYSRRRKESLEEVQMKTIALILCVMVVVVIFQVYTNRENIMQQRRWLVLGIIGVGGVCYGYVRWQKKKKIAWARQRATLQEMRHMDPFEFEELVATHLTSQGRKKVKVSPARKDGGYDIRGVHEGTMYIIQCKRYSAANKVPVAEVRAISGVAKQFGKDAVAMIVTTGPLTRDAYQEAVNYGVVVWDESCIIEKLGL